MSEMCKFTCIIMAAMYDKMKICYQETIKKIVLSDKQA